jgi:hypothetical protein
MVILKLRGVCRMSYPIFMPKPSTHRMHDPESIVPHIRPKSVHRPKVMNSGRLHNSTGTATGATRNLELFDEEFQSIFSF